MRRVDFTFEQDRLLKKPQKLIEVDHDAAFWVSDDIIWQTWTCKIVFIDSLSISMQHTHTVWHIIIWLNTTGNKHAQTIFRQLTFVKQTNKTS